MRIAAEKLSMHYNDAGRIIRVFDELDFVFESGSSAAIVGESGVGKTTLLYLLGLLEMPISGKITIGDTIVTDLWRNRGGTAEFRGAHIGFVFQFHHLLPEFDAVENVAMPLIVRGVPREDAARRARELLKGVGLGDRLSHRPGMLSGGEQQRVAIARAFVGNPGVVLADEPTGNLDHRTGGEVRELLSQFQHEFGITLVVVTHSMELARTMDRVVELTPEGLKEFGQ